MNGLPGIDAATTTQYNPFNVFKEREDAGGHLNFLTGAGGFLQSVIQGYVGWRVQNARLDFKPELPPFTGFVPAPAHIHCFSVSLSLSLCYILSTVLHMPVVGQVRLVGLHYAGASLSVHFNLTTMTIELTEDRGTGVLVLNCSGGSAEELLRKGDSVSRPRSGFSLTRR